MASFNIERFKRLPQKPDDVWRGGVFAVPIPFMDLRDEGPDLRLAFWASSTLDIAAVPQRVRQDDDAWAVALNCLLDFALTNEGVDRPGRVEVLDPDLTRYLEEKLAGAGIVFECRPDLKELEQAMKELILELADGPKPPGALEGSGVTVPRMQAFADAAATFCRARPWEQLTSDDLIAVEHPKPPAGLGFCTVLGATADRFGVGFFKSAGQFEKLQLAAHPAHFLARHSVWSCTFGSIEALPEPDADLWQEHDLAVASEKAYPFAACYSPHGKVKRPGSKQLSFMEGLLRALSQATGDELDAGRWVAAVETYDGPQEYRLTLPGMLEEDVAQDDASMRPISEPADVRRAMERSLANLQRVLSEGQFDSVEEINAFIGEHGHDLTLPAAGAMTPLEEAQELMYDAFETSGRRRRKLAKQALAVCPDCADAYVLLAEEAIGAETACGLFRKGVEAGKRALGPAPFKEDEGHFWGILETRPYMRARAGLAQCLWHLGQHQQAVKHYRELMRLNPGDNQGIRYLLAPSLLQLGLDKELTALLDAYDDGSAQWQYLEALALYRREGDTPLARKRLKKALKGNTHVPEFLLGRREPPWDESGTLSMGGEDEAAYCAAELGDHWRATPGALDWLEQIENPRSKGK